MAQSSPSRRALVDLPVNTLGTPSSMTTVGKASMGHKRQIQEVEEPEYAQSTSRVRVSPARSQSILKDDAPLGQTQPARSGAVSVSSSAPHIQVDSMTEELVEEMGEGDSQHSYKDSALSSVVDFDPDDTMVSQQTAATEVTQPLRSRISQHAETLRLRLRLAYFKVQTNQTNLPLSQLRISRNEALPSQDSTLKQNEQPLLPKLLPAPVLIPTAFSARMIARPQDLSSPPCSPDHSAQKESPEVFRTPALPRQRVSNAQEQLSSPPGSDERISKRRYEAEDNLTSSAVRGKAAIGLLGLRQER
ncbi:MAG: hypothetical protein ASARMPREDX12_004723 [Alectoria sarmentosa]|nr:MAG: hypothetical protein ASARMPREDX12_004723 [Alectoria sarmentosa]